MNGIDSFWSWIIKTFYIIPSGDKLTAKNTIVYTLDENLKYLPIQDEKAVSLQKQAIWLCVYIGIWAVIVIPEKTTFYGPFLIGFLTGLIIILIESFYYSTVSSLDFTTNPESRNSSELYILNTPQIKSIKKGEKIKNLNSYLQFEPGQGDYKVLIDNKTLPKDGENGYLFRADTFIKQSVQGKLRSINLEDFLDNSAVGIKKQFSPSTQEELDYFSQRTAQEAWASYYVSIIVLTWAMYITRSRWGSRVQLLWTILAFLMSVIAGGTVMFSTNVVAYNHIIYVRKRLLILAISFAITGIFIIN